MDRQRTELEQEAAAPLLPADEVAARFTLVPNDAARTAAQYQEAMSNLRFGEVFTDYMAYARWDHGKGWHGQTITPYGPIAISPAAAVLHYGQEVFEGLKAYRHDDGSIWTFRPGYNAVRLNASARRMAIPELPVDDFLASIVGLVRADARWVPAEPGSSLYLRPFVVATEPFLGIRAARNYEYYVIASPSGPYFAKGFSPIAVWVDQEYHRAGPGGTGAAKTAGNYAASLLPKVRAAENGFDEVLFLDAANNETIDELGGMNVFVVMRDGSVRTPALSGNILPGGTRSAIMDYLADQGVTVTEMPIKLSDLVAGIESGEVAEMFACGTAAVITAIGRLAGAGFDVTVPVGEMTRRIYQGITDIQLGRTPDRFGWLYQIA
ncbi:MAG: branched-chain amino acid aminotransferase [Trueperella sp.]|nr:branched-chain amino acid aminotransferase [Trueperella sp.]